MLSQSALEPVFANEGRQLNNARAIGIVCPHCKFAGRHFLDGKGEGTQSEDEKVMEQFAQNFETLCESWLRCDEESCRSMLPLMLQAGREMTSEDYAHYRSRWRFDHLVCPNGHPIRKPADWGD